MASVMIKGGTRVKATPMPLINPISPATTMGTTIAGTTPWNDITAAKKAPRATTEPTEQSS